jgi:hypothetical protein
MTQDVDKQENLKTGFVFPNEQILIVRPCLLRFCRNIYPAAKLLSTFLYHARKCNEQEPTFTMYRTQEQLVRDMCGDISEKTLHDVAVPTLQLAGFLDLEEQLKSNRYTIDLVVIRQALALYISNQESQPQLEKFLIDITQLEKFLIGKPELEKSLIDKKYFLSQLEKVLIHTRKISNCQRGRKPSSQDGSDGNSQNTENKRYKRDITLENNSVLSSDKNNATPSPEEIEKQIARLQAELNRLNGTPYQGNMQNTTDPGGSTNTLPKGGASPTSAGRFSDTPSNQNTAQEPPVEASVSPVQESRSVGSLNTQVPEFTPQSQETASEKEDIHEDRAHSMDSRDGDLDNLSRHPDTHSATDLRQDASSAVVGNNHLDGTAGDTRSGVATGVTNENLRDGETIGAEPTQGTANEKLRDNSYSPNSTTKPAVPATPEPAKPARTRGGKGAGSAEKPKKVKPVVPDEELALRKELHVWVNQRRGYSLQNRATTKQIIDENTACITLAHMLYVAQYEQNTEEGSTWDDFSFVWDYSVKHDKYWSQPNNKSRFGAYALLQMFAQTIVKRSKNNVTPIRPASPAQQEQTAEKAAAMDAAIQERLARMQQRQAI